MFATTRYKVTERSVADGSVGEHIAKMVAACTEPTVLVLDLTEYAITLKSLRVAREFAAKRGLAENNHVRMLVLLMTKRNKVKTALISLLVPLLANGYAFPVRCVRGEEELMATMITHGHAQHPK